MQININEQIAPSNAATIDQGVKIGNTYTKPEIDSKIEEKIGDFQLGNDLGVIKTTDEMPLTGVHFGKVFEAGTYTNFKDSSLASIVVSADPDLKGNFVFIEVKNGVAEKIIFPIEINLSDKIDPTNTTTAPNQKGVADYIPKEYNSLNLFDNSTVILDKFAPYYETGRVYPNFLEDAVGWFASQKIPIEAGIYCIKKSCAISFFGSDNKMIIGYPHSTEEPIKTPIGTIYCIVTSQIADLNNTMIIRGKKLPNYEVGVQKIKKEFLPSETFARKGNVVIISQKGGGNYTSINEALQNITDDNAQNPYTFMIYDGNYVESVNLCGRFVSLVGTNRENCVIRTYTNDYYNPPIDMAGNNHLFNLTIIADNDGVTTPSGGVGGLPAYGIHFDISGRLEGLGAKVQGKSVVKNCLIIGHNQHAVGQGLWTDTESIWEDCEFISYTTHAFRSHSYMPSGATNQRFLMRNCILHNPSNFAPIVVQDPNLAGGNDSTDTIYTFINSIAWNETGQKNSNELFIGHDLTGQGTLSGKIKLGKGSFGNNIPKLNY